MGASGPRVQQSSPKLDTFLAALVDLTGARAGIVRARAADSNQSQFVAASGLPEGAMAHEMSISGPCGICGEALRRRGVRIADASASSAESVATPSQERPCAATVAVSLDYRGSVVGVFALFFDGKCGPQRELIALLRPAGRLLGFAMASLHIEARERSLLAHAPLRHGLPRPPTHQDEPAQPIFDADARASKRATELQLDPNLRGYRSVNAQADDRSGSVCGLADGLTRREREVLDNIALGSSNKAIAKTLGISHETVKLHVRRIFAKLGFSSRVEAALFASKR